MTHEDSPNIVLGAGRMKLSYPFVMMHCSSQPAKKKKLVEEYDRAYHIAFIL
jgi:hypothetical protein